MFLETSELESLAQSLAQALEAPGTSLSGARKFLDPPFAVCFNYIYKFTNLRHATIVWPADKLQYTKGAAWLARGMQKPPCQRFWFVLAGPMDIM